MKQIKLSAVVTSLLVIAAGGFSPTSSTALAQATQPLYSFISTKTYRLYKTGPGLPSGLSDGAWTSEGIVAHVMPKPVSGTKSVYQLVKSDGYGVRYAYTSDPNEANKFKGGPADAHGIGQWMNQGPVFYVAAAQLPGTVPLYRLYAPARIVGGPEFYGMAAGTDSTFYTTKKSEKVNATNNGWVYQGIVGYVWQEPFPPAAPDLTIQQSTADDSSVRAVIANKGKINTGGQPVNVALFVYDKSGKQIFTTSKDAGGVSPGGFREVIIPAGKVGLRNYRYQLKVDSNNMISESNESNNETVMLDGPKGIKIVPVGDPSEKRLPIPYMRITGQKALSGGRTAYQLEVGNWKDYPGEFFQSMVNVLPSATCNSVETNARLLAPLSVIIGGAKPKRVGCKALNSPQDFQKLELIVNGVLEDSDGIVVTVEDRLTKTKVDSYPWMEGWTGLGKLLGTVGCKNFLNREGHYLCQNDQGFKACESLRKEGKPIKCSQAGKPAK